MRPRAVVVVVVLLALAWVLPGLRRDLIFDLTWWDAPPGEPAPLPAGEGPGLVPARRTRVVLIDGLSAEVAGTLPTFTALCKRGLAMTVDVGFPTVSLPVQTALWSGLTQQQTGVVARNGRAVATTPAGKAKQYGRPLVPPLRGIPSQIPTSIAIAENHGWIVRSLGFAHVEPPADPDDDAADADAAGWDQRWEAAATAAVTSDARLVLVHVLRVDTAAHKHGLGEDYAKAAAEADAILDRLLAADAAAGLPDARWFVLSDHGHVPPGGHGGTERSVRQVTGCIAGPGVVTGTAPLVHLVDVARALADSTGATLDPAARGRPLSAAVATPLAPDAAVPPLDLTRGAGAIFVLVVGLALAALSIRRWWLGPWWFAVACVLVLVIRGEPTLSTAMTYRADGRLLYTAWAAALPLATVSVWLGLGRTTLARVLAAQLALPLAASAAALVACGGWPAVVGAEVAPVAPRYTAWALALVLMVAHGGAAVALGVLARLVHPVFDRRARAVPPRSERADAG